jgi:integrase
LYTRDRAGILLLFRTGIRAGEILQMRIRDVNLAERLITVRRGKGNKGRVVPIRGDVVLALERLTLEPVERVGSRGRQIDRPPLDTDAVLYPAFTNGDRVVRSFPERPMAYNTFQKWWVERLKWAEVRYRKPHMARHTFATKLLRSGADISRVQQALGHASINATTVYLHNDLRDLEFAMEEMERKRGDSQ